MQTQLNDQPRLIVVYKRKASDDQTPVLPNQLRFIHNKASQILICKACADGGTRTRTVLKPGDFKSPVSAIPPHPRIMRSIALSEKERQAFFFSFGILFKHMTLLNEKGESG